MGKGNQVRFLGTGASYQYQGIKGDAFDASKGLLIHGSEPVLSFEWNQFALHSSCSIWPLWVGCFFLLTEGPFMYSDKYYFTKRTLWNNSLGCRKSVIMEVLLNDLRDNTLTLCSNLFRGNTFNVLTWQWNHISPVLTYWRKQCIYLCMYSIFMSWYVH